LRFVENILGRRWWSIRRGCIAIEIQTKSPSDCQGKD
jgi:hypothetical protein